MASNDMVYSVFSSLVAIHQLLHEREILTHRKHERETPDSAGFSPQYHHLKIPHLSRSHFHLQEALLPHGRFHQFILEYVGVLVSLWLFLFHLPLY
jgi:hypothetical protein